MQRMKCWCVSHMIKQTSEYVLHKGQQWAIITALMCNKDQIAHKIKADWGFKPFAKTAKTSKLSKIEITKSNCYLW